MQNKGIIDIVTNKNQGKPDMKSWLLLEKKIKNNLINQLKHSELAVNNLIIKKQNPNKRQASQK